jgi:hypothetical protein
VQAEEDPTVAICQREFDPETSPAFYRSLARYPTRTILPLQDEAIDLATQYGYVQLPDTVAFEARGITTGFPAGTYLPAADQFILQIIKQAWGDRPIYFATTTNAHRNLGLDRYVTRQGVAYKLLTPQEASAPGIVKMPQNDGYAMAYGAMLDLPRTRALLDDVFVTRDLIDRPHWADDATRGIPTYYGYVWLSVAVAEQTLGNQAAAEEAARMYERWMEMAVR